MKPIKNRHIKPKNRHIKPKNRHIKPKNRHIKLITGYSLLPNLSVTVHTGIQERGDEDCDKQGI